MNTSPLLSSIREGRPSYTAEGVCLARAIESLRPTGHRRVHDIFAKYFLGVSSRTVLKTLGSYLAPPATFASNGLYEEVITRHQKVDEHVEEAIKLGTQCLIILGAGYDTRAWRLARPGLRTIELDLKPTQARKLRCLKKNRSRFPEVQRQVKSVDFRTPEWANVLGRSSEPVVVIWEGVTMYLEPSAIIACAQMLSQQLAPGSRIIFDILKKSTGFRGWSPYAALQVLGEPIRSSWSLHEVPSLFEPLGFDMHSVAHLGADRGQSRLALITLERRNF